MNKEHVCSEKCNCPECGSKCHYSPRLNLHACSNVVNCRWKEPEFSRKLSELSNEHRKIIRYAGVAKLADASDLKSEDALHREGSIPSLGTIKNHDVAITFMGMPIHACEKYPLNASPMILNRLFFRCPYCGESLEK